MEQKAFYKSKVVWINALTFIVMVIALPEVSTLIPERVVPLVAAFSSAANLWLRFGTTTPLGGEDKK
jgi:hypothetical protein